MLSCHDLAHRCASDYIDGHLGWRRRPAVIFHLLICLNCRRFIRQMRQVRGVVLRRPAVAAGRADRAPSHSRGQENDYLARLARQLLTEYQRYDPER